MERERETKQKQNNLHGTCSTKSTYDAPSSFLCVSASFSTWFCSICSFHDFFLLYFCSRRLLLNLLLLMGACHPHSFLPPSATCFVADVQLHTSTNHHQANENGAFKPALELWLLTDARGHVILWWCCSRVVGLCSALRERGVGDETNA
jgi:hypothetical protein